MVDRSRIVRETIWLDLPIKPHLDVLIKKRSLLFCLANDTRSCSKITLTFKMFLFLRSFHSQISNVFFLYLKPFIFCFCFKSIWKSFFLLAIGWLLLVIPNECCAFEMIKRYIYCDSSLRHFSEWFELFFGFSFLPNQLPFFCFHKNQNAIFRAFKLTWLDQIKRVCLACFSRKSFNFNVTSHLQEV